MHAFKVQWCMGHFNRFVTNEQKHWTVTVPVLNTRCDGGCLRGCLHGAGHINKCNLHLLNIPWTSTPMLVQYMLNN